VWQNPRTQEKIAGAKESVKEMVPEVKERLHLSGHKSEGSGAANQELDPESGTASSADSAFSGQAAAGSSGTVPETEADVVSDPAHRDTVGNDWSAEGGATPGGAATNTDPRREPGI